MNVLIVRPLVRDEQSEQQLNPTLEEVGVALEIESIQMAVAVSHLETHVV